MAHADHLKLIKDAIEKKNITIWNGWRRENPDVGPDLRGADLRGADLSGEYWIDVDPGEILTRLDLSGTNLIGANLIRANLSNVDLIGAELSRANLCRAYLIGANLNGATLSKADLRNVKGLMSSQIKSAKNWEKAFYSAEILESLRLSPDHNERLRKATE